MDDKLTAEEISAKLQEVADKDMEDIVEDPVPVNFAGLEPDIEGWDEYVEWTLGQSPPEKEEA